MKALAFIICRMPNSRSSQFQQWTGPTSFTFLRTYQTATHATDDEGFLHNAFTDDWLSSSIEKIPLADLDSYNIQDYQASDSWET